MGKASPTTQSTVPAARGGVSWFWRAACLVGLIWLAAKSGSSGWIRRRTSCGHGAGGVDSPYGRFPAADDPFHFLPCTNATVPPGLDDPRPERSWSKLFEPDPSRWIWGNASSPSSGDDPFAGRGIYLCGYVDVPLDYTNGSDPRIVRLAVTKYQVSGPAGRKSARTVVIEPGGPGGSGTSYAFSAAERLSARLSDGQFDVLGWDPRGVNATQPALSCFPYDADRDRWSLLTTRSRAELASSPDAQLRLLDGMNDATFRACRERHGDLPRFVSTAFVVRDLEVIRAALDEDELTGYLVSYGTSIGQTYVSMFPDRAGRIILDGVSNARLERSHRGGFSWFMLDNVTDAWREGVLGECVAAGPEHCALAAPTKNQSQPVTLAELEARMDALFESILQQPVPGYTASSGPSLISYSTVMALIFVSLYNAETWPGLAQALADLEARNSTLAAAQLDGNFWRFDPTLPPSPSPRRPRWDELINMVVCADEWDAPRPDDDGDDPMAWWGSTWANMTARAPIGGDLGLFIALPCRRFAEHWPRGPAEVYLGDFNRTLRHPVLLVSQTHDPATPLRNGRALAAEMGPANARLVVHHGYGHSSKDVSACTEALVRDYILEGKLPDEPETACFADEKPYRYGVGKAGVRDERREERRGYLDVWAEHVREVAVVNPRLVAGMLP